jgi:hypothetical protein
MISAFSTNSTHHGFRSSAFIMYILQSNVVRFLSSYISSISASSWKLLLFCRATGTKILYVLCTALARQHGHGCCKLVKRKDFNSCVLRNYSEWSDFNWKNRGKSSREERVFCTWIQLTPHYKYWFLLNFQLLMSFTNNVGKIQLQLNHNM